MGKKDRTVRSIAALQQVSEGPLEKRVSQQQLRVELPLQSNELHRLFTVHLRQGLLLDENVLDQVDAPMEFLPQHIRQVAEGGLCALERAPIRGLKRVTDHEARFFRTR